MKALVIGARGFTGSLLLRLLAHHEKITSLTACSLSQPNTPITDNHIATHNLDKLTSTNYVGIDEVKNEYDVIFSALPHGVSADIYYKITKLFQSQEPAPSKKAPPKTQSTDTLPPSHPIHGASSKKANFVYIDISADFRFNNIDIYNATYPDSRIQKNAFFSRAYHNAVYGLSELQRDKIASSDIIACPGCYPTSILIPLIPILKYVTPIGNISIASISGISGAGMTPSPHNTFCNRMESVAAYSPGRTHRHYEEMKYQLEHIAYVEPSFTFTPQLAPLSQGMLSTIHIPLNNDDINRAKEVLIAQYIGEHFISVYDNQISEIDTKKVRGTNGLHINIHEEDNMLIVFSCIDNLWKGAAGQAVQNFNIRFGFDEITGLQYFPT